MLRLQETERYNGSRLIAVRRSSTKYTYVADGAGVKATITPANR
ncbi:MAG: hypothetical protein P8J27_06870 [Mariniblastus sp.]|nr:hypothetical protein [Mariniblastus sp.]